MGGYGAAMKRRKLPTGIQTFRKVREEGCYYVDKTAYIERLVSVGTHYLLSRPRRFGKSLFVDTLKELFEGSDELFRGLAIHDRWDWTVRHPVVRLSFAAGSFKEPGQLAANFNDKLANLEREAGTTGMYETPEGRFAGVLRALRANTGERVVLLVDEYDRPITDALESPDIARANRDFLRGVYEVVKECDELLRFSFFTGVTKFSKVSVFSDLNNLTDAGLAVTAEESTSAGRSDMVVRHDGGVCVFEFKTGGGTGAALARIRERGYADKHRQPGRPIHLVAVQFSEETRNIDVFAVERA